MSGMTKVGTGAKLEDSNIANYGSKEMKDLKKAAADGEPAWKGCGKAVGVEVWRIEKFKVVAVPKETYGSFFAGDSYICLHTYVSPENKEKKLYNVHFWLGLESSQDEMGTAAYKTVELDDYLGDLPVQYREVQGSESDEFLALWKGKINILKGGIASGFNTVKPAEYKPRLMHLKGQKQIRVTEVDLKVSSLNQGDVFILDAGLNLYQWNAPSSGIGEKRKGAEMLEALKRERNGKPKSAVVDGLEDYPEFWTFFGGKPAKDQIAAATSDDIKVETKKTLYELSDKSGALKKTQVGECASGGTFKKSELKTDEVFILDLGTMIFAWIGKGASAAERANGIKFATDHLATTGRPMSTPVSRVMEGAEPPHFKQNFS